MYRAWLRMAVGGSVALRLLRYASGVPVMTGSQDPVAGGDRLRAGHADRERAIEALKDAFVQGRLTKDELGARAGRALAARTYGELAALTADISASPAGPADPARPPTPPIPPDPARRRPLARAAAKSGGCLAIAFAAMWVGGSVVDPDVGPDPYYSWAPLCLFVAFITVIAALRILVHGVVTSLEQRGSRGQLSSGPNAPQRA
jgi:hypothetical protein